MAQYLLHGTLMVTIYKAQNLVMEKRKSGGAPNFIRKVSLQIIHNILE
jgi:phospholipase D1/2